jgi:mono/diheme cytochrome c family protein
MIKTKNIIRYAIRTIAAPLALLLLCSGAHSQCPQYREAPQIPSNLATQTNPLEPTRRHLRAGKRLYKDREVGCFKCHGKKGDGAGPLAFSFAPPPRNFRCAETMNSISDGEIFSAIKHGVPTTAMPAHPALTDKQIWQLVWLLRGMAGEK